MSKDKEAQVFVASIKDGQVSITPIRGIQEHPAVTQYEADVTAVVSTWTREDLLEKHNKLRASRGLPPRTMEEFNS